MKHVNKFTKLKLGALALILGTSFHAAAQTTYTVDFETTTTTPSSKSYASLDPITATNSNDPSISMDWIMPGVYMGNMSDPADYYDGDRSGRMRLTGNASGDPAYIASDDYFADGVETVEFTARMYGNETGDSIRVEHQAVGATTWTTVETFAIPSQVQGEATFTSDVNQTSPVKIRLIKASTGNERISIDNIAVTTYAASSTVLNISGVYPTGDNISATVDHLKINFSQDVVANAGNIELYEDGNATPTVIDVTDASVVVTGSQVEVTGITLDYSTTYYVLMDAGAFKTPTDIMSDAIDDENFWRFTTVDEVLPLGEFAETFDECDNVSSSFGVFTQYSVEGTRTWKCSNFGNNDDHAVYINGGSEPNISEINEDWLITKTPIDITTANEPTLSFAYQTRFDGFLEKTVQISTDYDGSGNPHDFTWTTLDIASYDVDHGHGNWSNHEYDLSAHQNEPFYLAFTYESDDQGAKELTIDDIEVSATVSILDLTNNVKALIVGSATRNAINLNIESPTAQHSNVNIYDMQGRLVHQDYITLNHTAQTVTLNPNLGAAGLYIIQLEINGKTYQLKAMVQ